MIPELTASAGAPRIVAIAHPFGTTLGRPGDAAGQLAVLRAALETMEAMEKPGGVVQLPFEWTSTEKLSHWVRRQRHRSRGTWRATPGLSPDS